MAPIEPEEIEKILDRHEEKIEGMTDDIQQLKLSCGITEKRLENIELAQKNIVSGQLKNRELYQDSLKSVNEAMNKSADSLLLMNSNVNTLFSNVLTYITERDKSDSKTDIQLNEGWNKREIKIAVTGGIVSIILAIVAVWQALI